MIQQLMYGMVCYDVHRVRHKRSFKSSANLQHALQLTRINKRKGYVVFARVTRVFCRDGAF